MCSKLFFLLPLFKFSSFSWKLLFLQCLTHTWIFVHACLRVRVLQFDTFCMHFGTCQSIKLLHIGLFWISGLKYQPRYKNSFSSYSARRLHQIACFATLKFSLSKISFLLKSNNLGYHSFIHNMHVSNKYSQLLILVNGFWVLFFHSWVCE